MSNISFYYFCAVLIFIHFTNLNFMVSITLIDVRSTQENPIKPKTIVVELSEVASIVNNYLDENHTIVISQVQTEF